MQLALIGFSKSGKTTIFNALTGANAEVSAFASKGKTHRAAVTVPDERLDKLCALFQSKKLVHAVIDYVDPVGIRREEAGQGSGLGEEMLNTIAAADALVAVVRAFEDEASGPADSEGDYEATALELLLSDLKKVDTRLERVKAQAQRIGGPDKKKLEDEARLMERLKAALEAETPLRYLAYSEDEKRLMRSFQFLTMKPLIVVLNAGEDAAPARALAEKWQAANAERRAALPAPERNDAAPGAQFVTLSGQTEMEIAQLAPEDRAEFLASYGIDEAGASKMIRLSYDTLGLISFFTVGPTEAHAWTIRRDTPAVEAAGAIHSDLQRGFIRAQVVHWDDLLAAGSMGEARKRATLRLEGKDYIVKDGDVIEVMFSV